MITNYEYIKTLSLRDKNKEIESDIQDCKNDLLDLDSRCQTEIDKLILKYNKNIEKTKSPIRKGIRQVGYCPACGKFVTEYTNECEKCGQALDWSENK